MVALGKTIGAQRITGNKGWFALVKTENRSRKRIHKLVESESEDLQGRTL